MTPALHVAGMWWPVASARCGVTAAKKLNTENPAGKRSAKASTLPNDRHGKDWKNATIRIA
jgi:hypothetical protein